jgi:hypothetical protein
MADQVLAEDAGLAELNLARREHWVAQIERHAAARPDQPALRFRGRRRHDASSRTASGGSLARSPGAASAKVTGSP